LFQLSKVIGLFALIVLSSSALASSISDCIHRVKITKLTKKEVSFKVVKLESSLGNSKCVYKLGQTSRLDLKKIKTEKLNLVEGKNFRLRSMKYQGKGHKGIVVTGERYYFYKI
jgi:hypothetical protein